MWMSYSQTYTSDGGPYDESKAYPVKPARCAKCKSPKWDELQGRPFALSPPVPSAEYFRNLNGSYDIHRDASERIFGIKGDLPEGTKPSIRKTVFVPASERVIDESEDFRQ
jgi:hypothetical protein